MPVSSCRPLPAPSRRRFACAAACSLLAGSRAAAAQEPGARTLRRALESAECALEGRSGERRHVFFDPLCPACALLYERTRGPVRSGRLRLRWIPVSLLGPDSLRSAAGLLAAPDRMRALARTFEHRVPHRVPARRVLAMVPAVLGNGALLRWLAGPQAATPSVLVEGPGQRWVLEGGVAG